MGRRRIMLIGPSGCGKTTLANAINGEDRPVKRTQDMIFGRYTMDVPGAYIETPWMYRHLICAAQNHAAHILMLVDPSAGQDVGAPQLARVFTCPVTGVMTKSDLIPDVSPGPGSDVRPDMTPDNRPDTSARLERLGVDRPYFKVSARTGTGMTRLMDYLSEKGLMQ